MTLWALSVRVGAERRDGLAAWLVARTGQAVEERPDGSVVAYVEDAAVDATVEAVRGREGDDVPIERSPVVPIDWVTRWRDGIGARTIGRILLAPSWIEALPGAGQVRLTLDPETAFGSGEHGSTRGALALLDRHLRRGGRMLDLGSGSGILAIAAALLGASRAVGIELDGDAVPVAQSNAEKNGVSDRVVFVHADAGRSAAFGAPADLICSNILRNINVSLIPAIQDAMAPGAVVIFAGMEVAEEALFRPVLAGAGFEAFDEVQDDGWWSVAARRR
ncbi:MAG TPA: 50S ribosomal protein L11 methyltransferase [Gemmatimonadales bacterium]|nr:50S ribosomal protein L11 methyltransferase [Gemmatimonadales bacterium]